MLFNFFSVNNSLANVRSFFSGQIYRAKLIFFFDKRVGMTCSLRANGLFTGNKWLKHSQ